MAKEKITTLRQLVAAVEAEDPAFMDANLEFHILSGSHRAIGERPETEDGRIGWGFPRGLDKHYPYLGIELWVAGGYKLIRDIKRRAHETDCQRNAEAAHSQ